MFARLGRSAFLAIAMPVVVAQAQDLDWAKSVQGWARFDPTGAATFYDASTKHLVTWMKDAGILARINVSKADMVPERWVVDDDRIWIMAGTTMKQISKTGQVTRSASLPAEVADADFIPPDGIVLSYRTLKPFIEKRDIKTGSVSWSFGSKPKKGEATTSKVLHRVLRNDETNVVVVSGSDIAVSMLDGKKGTLLGQAVFSYNDGTPPALSLGENDRGPAVWYWGKSVAFSSIPASAVPSLNQKGLLLARLDFASSVVEFLPTGLIEGSILVGILEDRATFVAPGGGLVFIPIK
jgi:hypothetical protein